MYPTTTSTTARLSLRRRKKEPRCSDDAVDLYTCGRVGVEFVRSFCMKEPCALMMVLMHMHVEERALKSINNCQTFFEKTEKKTPCALMMLLMHTHVEGRALSLLGHLVL